MLFVPFLDKIREGELESVRPSLPAGAAVLEVAAGTGAQAKLLQASGFQVSALDLKQSFYADARVFPVQEYDGQTFPFPSASFDVVYMSHFLWSFGLMSEITRVLRPGGLVIHVLPTPSWRWWTSLAAFPNAVAFFAQAIAATLARRPAPTWRVVLRQFALAIAQPALGPSLHAIVEFWRFRPGWVRRRLQAAGLEVVAQRPTGLFYTGYMVFGPAIPLRERRAWARVLGSASMVFVSRRARVPTPPAATSGPTARQIDATPRLD